MFNFILTGKVITFQWNTCKNIWEEGIVFDGEKWKKTPSWLGKKEEWILEKLAGDKYEQKTFYKILQKLIKLN